MWMKSILTSLGYRIKKCPEIRFLYKRVVVLQTWSLSTNWRLFPGFRIWEKRTKYQLNRFRLWKDWKQDLFISAMTSKSSIFLGFWVHVPTFVRKKNSKLFPWLKLAKRDAKYQQNISKNTGNRYHLLPVSFQLHLIILFALTLQTEPSLSSHFRNLG